MCDRTFGEIVDEVVVRRRGGRPSRRARPPLCDARRTRVVDHGAQDGTMLVFGPARVPGTRHAIDED
jgi:hypothetical protein